MVLDYFSLVAAWIELGHGRLEAGLNNAIEQKEVMTVIMVGWLLLFCRFCVETVSTSYVCIWFSPPHPNDPSVIC